jgi:hypothetical protein
MTDRDSLKKRTRKWVEEDIIDEETRQDILSYSEDNYDYDSKLESSKLGKFRGYLSENSIKVIAFMGILFIFMGILSFLYS